ncbi:Poly(A) polymerase central domain-containing protein [Gilbertella persicaria]|uniref:Poly(A) polymerase central domain-containing protein n=1 Tax=Gilbertella persicaria TaxID=101096 RepID=UPI002220CE56|nr:Poly(A) polymerase central domain-containing protein [Gilbertella persicaria]KAI8098386.1 Poly(A) polymerase central domain-containing protein [Gilbertella persicaria]
MSRTDISDEFWVNYLQNAQVTETHEEKLKREKVIVLLRSTLQEFIRCVKKEHDYKREVLPPILFPFGSYGIGGYIKNADIDIVMIAPSSIKRNDFFKFFPTNLKQLATIRDVECIKRTAVPIIKCVVDNISIDISFVRLKEKKVDAQMNFLDDTLLNDLDEVCLASIDGPRVHQFIMKQIKSQHLTIFRTCLQCIKYWATRRQIYNKPTGYLNGSSWTMLLLKTYQKEKNNSDELTITHLLEQFFLTWLEWPWPAPVILTNHIPGKDGTRLEYRTLKEFEESVMPIVSPCYPVISTAPNVTKSTLKVIQREFERGELLSHDEIDPHEVLRKLFHGLDYFKRFTHYLSITTSCSRQRSHEIWTRKMPYNVPQLVSLIESRRDFKLIQPAYWPKQYTKNYRTNRERAALQQGELMDEMEATSSSEPFNPGTLHLTYYFIGIKTEESCKSDITPTNKSFLAILDTRKSTNDDDVHFAISHMKRKQVAKLMNIKCD